MSPSLSFGLEVSPAATVESLHTCTYSEPLRQAVVNLINQIIITINNNNNNKDERMGEKERLLCMSKSIS